MFFFFCLNTFHVTHSLYTVLLPSWLFSLPFYSSLTAHSYSRGGGHHTLPSLSLPSLALSPAVTFQLFKAGFNFHSHREQGRQWSQKEGNFYSLCWEQEGRTTEIWLQSGSHLKGAYLLKGAFLFFSFFVCPLSLSFLFLVRLMVDCFMWAPCFMVKPAFLAGQRGGRGGGARGGSVWQGRQPHTGSTTSLVLGFSFQLCVCKCHLLTEPNAECLCCVSAASLVSDIWTSSSKTQV